MFGLIFRSSSRRLTTLRLANYNQPLDCFINLKSKPFILSRCYSTTIDAQATSSSSSKSHPQHDPIIRSLKLGGIMLSVSLGVCLIVAINEYGFEKLDDYGAKVPDEYTGDTFAVPKRVIKELYLWWTYIREPSREQLIPERLQEPYYQPKYTLVIEMSGVLVHPEWTYSTGWRFKKRPAVDHFIKQIGYPNFEVVIYTKETGFIAMPIIESLDPEHLIMWKLFRQETKYIKGEHVKDLNKLGRDLSKVIMIDFDPGAFQLNPDNALRVPKWEGDTDDTSLYHLAALLKTILASNVEDVRPVVQYYSQFDDPIKAFRENTQALHLQASVSSSQPQPQTSSLLKGITERYSRR